MAVTESLQLGQITTLVQNTVYALPPKVVRLYTSTAAATFQQSNDQAWGANTAVTLTDGSAELAGGFLKSTAGAALVVVKSLV